MIISDKFSWRQKADQLLRCSPRYIYCWRHRKLRFVISNCWWHQRLKLVTNNFLPIYATNIYITDYFKTKLSIHHEIDLNNDRYNVDIVDASFDDEILDLPDVPIAVQAGCDSDNDSVETDTESVDISQFIQSSGRIKDSFLSCVSWSYQLISVYLFRKHFERAVIILRRIHHFHSMKNELKI